jgi:hypothetical protein
MRFIVPGVEPEHDFFAVLDGGKTVVKICSFTAGINLLVGLSCLVDKILFYFVHVTPPVFLKEYLNKKNAKESHL